MALERSVLTAQDARALLHAHYGLHLSSLERLAMGTANCYKVYADSGRFFLKEFPSSFTPEDAAIEYTLLQHLAANSFPVARILPTLDNTAHFQFCGHVFCLQEFAEGRSFGYDDFPGELLPAMAQTLGRLHAVLRGYPLARFRADKWFCTFSGNDLHAEYTGLLSSVPSDDPYAERIRADLAYKSELALRCEDYRPLCEGVTFTASHGDYHGCQLICEGSRIKAVTDFSGACVLPAVWEIIRSFAQSSSPCRETAAIDPDALVGYVREYMRFAPLTRADLRAMPYVYLLQLARSKYGYPQYLRAGGEENLPMLRFALWRTDICRELESKAVILSERLQKLL